MDTKEPSYSQLVYEVMQASKHPLTFQEIFDEVNRRRPITTRNPRVTIRNVLSQGMQLISLGETTYGYLPHLAAGSQLRVPLGAMGTAYDWLSYPQEVRDALWPSFYEAEKRRDRRPVQVRLPNGQKIAFELDFAGAGDRGTRIPQKLQVYLAENNAAKGDSLLVRVPASPGQEGKAWLERKRNRNEQAVARRNQEIADAAVAFMRTRRSLYVFAWELAVALLARGMYKSDVAPDPLEEILSSDPRFTSSRSISWVLTEYLNDEVLAEIESHQAEQRSLEELVGQRLPHVDEPPAGLDIRRAMEKTLSDVGAAMAGKEFDSLEAANAFLQELLASGGVPDRTPETPLEQAQDLMYEAWETPDLRRRISLARKALQLSPDCADAYVLLAENSARSAGEAAELYTQGVAAGERALGPEAFTEYEGQFWGFLETRPYMRARLGLAHALWEAGRRQEAMGHAWDMLRLNPGDNQGVRYQLLSWLLKTGDDLGTKRLLNQYPDDVAADWQYGRALHAFRLRGDTPQARQALEEARGYNPHVPAYLLRRKRLPSRLPDTIGFGDESEAVSCAAEFMAAWQAAPGALDWLAKQVG